jgi:energy-coupling factor transporter transmembrane protein EcfT
MLAGASPYEMIKALRTWHIPEPLIIIVSFTIQFLRQLQVDFKILNQNLLKRNISFKKMSWKRRLELGGQLIMPVIGRLFSDIKYKVIAMELNGYGSHRRPVSFQYKRCAATDYLVMLNFLVVVCLIFI